MINIPGVVTFFSPIFHFLVSQLFISHYSIWSLTNSILPMKCLESKYCKTSKSNLSLYSLYYSEECNEFARPISASLRPGNTAPFQEMSRLWRAVGNTVSDLTGPRFEPQTSHSRDERVTARPAGRCYDLQYR